MQESLDREIERECDIFQQTSEKKLNHSKQTKNKIMNFNMFSVVLEKTQEIENGEFIIVSSVWVSRTSRAAI